MPKGLQGFQKGHGVFKGAEKGHFKKGFKPWHTGKKVPHQSNEKSPHWKGNKVKYRGLHNWVERNLGKPDICEDCGRSGLKSHFIHWANKSGKYLRKLSDWVRLCALCHKKYDKKNV